MKLTGKTHQFLGDVLPSDYRAEIFGLVDSAWQRVKLPRSSRLEPRITGLLQLKMIEEQESQYESDPPFDIREDVKIRDTTTGKEVERMDLGIWLRQRYITGQRPYFVFESKKLNIERGGVPDSNVHEYLGEGGIGHLIAGGYQSERSRCGMLAYVMDGNVAKAKQAVEKQLANKSETLQLHGETKIHASTLMPKGSPHGETHHTHAVEKFKIFHLFLSVSQK